MSNQENLKNAKQPKPGEVDHQLLPKVTSDEIDLEVDIYRDEEIAVGWCIDLQIRIGPVGVDVQFQSH